MTEETEPFMFSVQSFAVSIFCAVFCSIAQLQQEWAPSWKEKFDHQLECSKRFRLENEEERGNDQHNHNHKTQVFVPITTLTATTTLITQQ